MLKLILVLFIVTASSSACALYKCTVDGKTKYQATPCENKENEKVINDYKPPESEQNTKTDVEKEIAEINNDPETAAMEDECTEAKAKQTQGTEKLTVCARLQERLQNKASHLRDIQVREETLAEQARQRLRDIEREHQDRLRELDRLR